ncbi:hypothetical protein [Methylocella sp. CPCC 101449]|jgi:hypothetical protein|uniref:hypothetical protein n=1 Tax=Methylocella sp. CPCC 101449 TaxID=2987531 RepID=UPI00288F82D1|nr:hypothetical protein [Methylocella sp. CPCC 101449]MDT2022678.1 hypothetical protein [Methylocella sp. CPCC 101449]HEV2572596.1 hypothetical protein [Beijerinckiaceae bacterium]
MSHYLPAPPLLEAARRVAAAQQKAKVMECGYAPVNHFLMPVAAFEALLNTKLGIEAAAARKIFALHHFFVDFYCALHI